MIVRHAEIPDYAEMIELVKEFFRANSFVHLGVDIDVKYIAKLVEKLTMEQLMLILETDDKMIVGGIGGMMIAPLFNGRTKVFQEVFFYIKDGFRKYSHLLLTELEGACKRLNIGKIIMAHPDDGSLKEMTRFYNSRGYKTLEVHFIKRVNL